jgi:hypothetical protein
MQQPCLNSVFLKMCLLAKNSYKRLAGISNRNFHLKRPIKFRKRRFTANSDFICSVGFVGVSVKKVLCVTIVLCVYFEGY